MPGEADLVDQEITKLLPSSLDCGTMSAYVCFLIAWSLRPKSFVAMVVNIGKRFMEDDTIVVYADPCTITHFAKDTSASSGKNNRSSISGSDDLGSYLACEKYLS